MSLFVGLLSIATNWPLAQSVEQSAHNGKVVGS
jgi:hypothetical protein